MAAARRIPNTPSPDDGTPSAIRHCESTSISVPCRSSVCSSSAVSRPSCEELPPRPYASSSTIADRLMTRAGGSMPASWHPGLAGAAWQSSLPLTIPCPTMCSSAGRCNCLTRCSVASPSPSNCAFGIRLCTSRASRSAPSRRSSRSARKAFAAGLPGAGRFALAPGLSAMITELPMEPAAWPGSAGPARSRPAPT